MHSPHTQCDLARLESYLQGAADAEEMQSIELHLDRCARCRQQIQLLAADNEFWTVATASLETRRTRDDEVPPLTVANCLNAIEQGLLEAAVQNEIEDGTRRYLQHWLGPAEADDSLGSLNEYEVLSVVGSGGMGLVLKARDRNLGRLVAIKTLRQHLTGELSARRRFAREAQVAASLRHHNIVDIYTVEVWRDVPYFVMPFLHQGTLLDFKRTMQGRGFTLDETLSIAQQIASGLAAAHRQGMIHRDIKPSNILIDNGLERILIADFGLARSIHDEVLTRSGWLAGTPQFMSPEQARGESIDHRSDLFSLGSLMYWLVTGQTPFAAETDFGVVSRIVNDRPAELAKFRSDLPVEFIELLHGLLAKDPDMRPNSAQDVANWLEQFQKHQVDPTIQLPARFTQSQTPRSRKLPAHVGLVSLVVLPLLAIVFFTRQWDFDRSIDGGPAQVTHLGMQGENAASHLNAGTTASTQGDSPISVPANTAVQVSEENSAENSAETALAHADAMMRSSIRFGPLDSLDELSLLAELPKGVNTRYWLERLANLPAHEIPLDILPVIERVANSPTDIALQSLAQQIIKKSPFEEIDREQP